MEQSTHVSRATIDIHGIIDVADRLELARLEYQRHTFLAQCHHSRAKAVDGYIQSRVGRLSSKLIGVVALQAAQQTCACESAGAVLTSIHIGDASDQFGKYRYSAICLRAVGQLTLIVVAPAHDLPVVHHCTGVIETRCNVHGATEHLDGCITIAGGAIAKLTLRVLTPAPHVAASENAGVIAACNDGRAAADPEDIHWHIACRIRAIAQLSEVIVAPTLDATLWRDRTCMSDASCDCVSLTTGDGDEAQERY